MNYSMDKTRSKNLLGIFAILIMLHHLGQKASAFWVPEAYRRHGLEPFVPIGYLLVSFFFFTSGYGLIKSARSKEDYFKGFLKRRMNRILMIFVITNIIYLAVRFVFGNVSLPVNPYSWYVYTIIILYFGFFFIYRKENKFSLVLMGLWILAYTLISYVMIQGNWWFNSAPVFLLGIYVADHEVKAGEKANKIVRVAILAVIFAVTFTISETIDGFYRNLGITDYGIVNLIIVVLQIVACSCFSYAIYILIAKPEQVTEKEVEGDSKKKVSIPQRIVSFYGNMTLEFYLIHGLFVQIFGHHFINDSTKPVCYIESVPLYVLVVFVLSSASAFVLKKAGDIITDFYGRSPMFKKIFNDQKRTIIVVAILFVLITIGYSVHRHGMSNDAAKTLEEYQKENITYVEAGGTKVATYMAGEGDYTVVLLGADSEPCSTLYLRPLADKLSDTNRVVIIDYPGKGYSEDSDAERTNDYYADVIHESLTALGVTDNIILVPNQISGVYCYKYLEKYPDGVKGLVGFDMVMPVLAKRFLDGNYNSVDEYKWYLKQIGRLEAIDQWALRTTGYISLQTPIYDYMFYGSGLKKYYPVMEEMHVRKYMNAAHRSEQSKLYDNCVEMEDFKMPSDLSVSFLLDNYIKETNIYGVNWQDEYKKMISNESCQTITVMNGDPNSIYYNPGIIATKIDELISSIDQ